MAQETKSIEDKLVEYTDQLIGALSTLSDKYSGKVVELSLEVYRISAIETALYCLGYLGQYCLINYYHEDKYKDQ